ncbi:YqzL-like protein [Pelagirhabdus alkalitolerans]|uniref:YqzL-like protein n=1 Tax=Pelagirhabdus alkalitolerans TaxID=1612202 RepID=A0A1G6HYA4_9BACI|nr:YqzL family protein [Pelagirhabdus alkalitolerans]SDB98466.1 YqzL-like protein [Pelagirhabdus alkalitolerans]
MNQLPWYVFTRTGDVEAYLLMKGLDIEDQACRSDIESADTQPSIEQSAEQ